MGVVYRAHDNKLNRTVALKFLPQELSRDEDANQRFIQEAQAASALNHPNVCVLHDIKQADDGRLYIVMPFYEGQTLKYRIQGEQLDVARAREIARQVAIGLEAAHRRGIVHRDIKPANIMVTDDDRAVILDFGLAKLTGGIELTTTGSTLGTAPYMSPEQIRGEAVDHRTDLWSLGVVLYEMLAKRRPFDASYHQAVAFQILNDEPLPLDSEDDLALLVEDLLSKDPNDRPASGAEVATRLGATEKRNVQAIRSAFSLKWLVGMGIVLTAVAAAILSLGRLGSPDESLRVHQPRLVVLPFANQGEVDDEYFAVGVSDEITTRLTEVSALRVIPTGSARKYRDTNMSPAEIGEELKVDYLLEGSVRWARLADGSSRIRINPRLVRIHGNTQLWAQTYDRSIDDVFAVQTDVAMQVVNNLNVRLLSSEGEALADRPTDNVGAYNAYFRGRSYAVGTDFERAIPLLEQAITDDPEFLSAYYELHRMYAKLNGFTLPSIRPSSIKRLPGCSADWRASTDSLRRLRSLEA